MKSNITQLITHDIIIYYSPDPNERLAGVVAIDELGSTTAFGESVSRLSDLIRVLMDAFTANTDYSTMEHAALTLGRLVRIGGASISDVVEDQVKRGLHWLASPRQEHARLAGVIILQELANASPAIFNVHVRSFIEVIWNPLRDPRQNIRDAAVSALKACLILVEKRETRYRVQWYYRLFEETQRGLTRVTSVETVHGSLLALGELLRHSGEFMLARYREVCDTVLRFRESKEKIIRRAVITLLPRLAAFAPERFVRSYLKQSTEHLLTVLSSPNERGAGFIAVGEMATALASAGVAGHMKTPDDFLRPIAAQIRECLLARGRGGVKTQCSEALECAGTLCMALHEDWQLHMAQLLEPALSTGLSDSLVLALHQTVDALPDLLPRVQDLLLDLLSLALARRPFNPATHASTVHALQVSLVGGDLQGSPLIRLALQTLGGFSLVPHPLLEFVRDHVVPYLDDPEPPTRRAAALATCRIIERHVEYGHVNHLRLTTMELRSIDAVVQRLLASAVADPATSVRQTVLNALSTSESLDHHLGQAESLHSLFVALNDENATVRSLAIHVSGHLSHINPAYVNPVLRRLLLQLLSDIDHSPDSKQREDSAKLLGTLVRAAPRLVLPYSSAILRGLLSKLRVTGGSGNDAVVGGSSNGGSIQTSGGTGVTTEDGFHVAILETLGELAAVAGEGLSNEVPEMLPLIIDALGESSSMPKRLVAARTLGRVVESTGFVVQPYVEYPQLLGILLKILGEGGPSGRREISRVLGIIGALDPHIHKLNLAELQGEGKLEREGVRPQFPGRPPPGTELGTLIPGMEAGMAFQDLLPAPGLVASSEDYYPTVAINALMRVLRDPTMSSLYSRAVHALFKIVRSMGLGFVPYLHKVVPVLLTLTRAVDEVHRRVEMFKALTDLVVLMQQHIRKFLPDFLALVDAFWSETPAMLPHILNLLAELSSTLRDDLRQHTPELLPKFVSLFTEAERTGDFSMIRPALSALRALGPVLEDNLPLLLPSLVRVICPSGPGSAPLVVQEDTLHAMQDLLPRMQLASYSSAILHPLIRVVNGPSDELREHALDVICSVALAVGPDFSVFVPTIKKIMARHRMPPHTTFNHIAARVLNHEPPCMSGAPDWETSSNFLASEHLSKARRTTTGDKSALKRAMAGAEMTLGAGEGEDANGIVGHGSGSNGGLHGEGLVALRRAWESSQRSTREDWAEWMRNFAIELLKQSPSNALQACSSLAQINPAMARDLFAAGFVSCWSELDEGMQEQLVRSLEAALASPTIPPDIVTTLLNLAEFMEHNEKALPLDTRTLGALAEKCHAFAKALHYKELEFQTTPHSAVEALISINNQLRQPDAAVGVLDVAQKKLAMELKESWYEKLQRWEDALKAYTRKVESTKPGSAAHAEALLGECRCLAALAEWDKLFDVCKTEWPRVEPPARRSMAPIAAHAAWQLGHWDQMKQYVDIVTSQSSGGNSEGAFLHAVLDVKNGNLKCAASATERARELLGMDMAALVGESYERAYGDMVRVQQLTELEEIIIVKAAEDGTSV